MAEITVDEKTFEVAEDTRLVLALEDNGVDILHLCGGNAKCTTCRVEITEGEPSRITAAERDKLQADGLTGEVRLSCQVLCEGNMTVKPLMRVSTTDHDSAGGRPEDGMTPDPEWVEQA